MNSPDDKVITSDDLPEGDIIKILLDQHADIRELLDRVSTSSGDSRATAFAHLRTLLAVHETAEEMILRPETKNASGEEVADARNDEEAEATEVLKELESMEVDTPAPDGSRQPHAQWAVGPFAAMVDRARDLLSKGPS